MRYLTFLLALCLSACGVTDVATTAATSANIQADQIKQGKATQEKVQADLSNASQAAEQRTQNADAAAH